MKYTAKEMAVIRVLWGSSAGNGHDFGFTEDARGLFENSRSHAGVISSLVKKGLIEVIETVRTDTGVWTSFVFNGIFEDYEATAEKIKGILMV